MMEPEHIQEEKSEITVREELDKPHDDLESNNEDFVPTQGIFAHSTSLEDFITDEVGNLDLQHSSTEEREHSDVISGSSVMKSSIHELQGENPALQLIGHKDDTSQNSNNGDVKSGER